ncbi:uncharacterized protein LOC112565737 isoform X2 [Pomacea canaliculata]|uniref:uncharacterized protein LOC112565737 isoform X2 n=1 Tax=Pomacea canaliculata TaxID=400727 RepID=UPI000D72F0CE|nr:uncharacterized protein LOC112565737 isoform X2 [Pomacea canaliculata]
MAIHTPTVGLVRVWYAAMTIASLDARHASNPDFIWTGRSQHRSERSAGAGLRVIKGSSSFTDKTWKENVSNIYGGDSYLKSSAYVTHPSEMPTICTNVFDARPDGEVHTYFICPQAQNPPDFDWCCGMQGREECCQNRRQSSSEQKRSFWWPHTYGTPHLLLCKERSPSKLQLQLL